MRRGRPRTDAHTRISPAMCRAHRGPRRITFHIPAPVGAPPWTPRGLFLQTVSWTRDDPPTRHRVLLASQLSPARCRSPRPPASIRQPATNEKAGDFPAFSFSGHVRQQCVVPGSARQPCNARRMQPGRARRYAATVQRAADAAGRSPALRGNRATRGGCSRAEPGATGQPCNARRMQPGRARRYAVNAQRAAHAAGQSPALRSCAVIRPPDLPPSASRAAAGGHAWHACPGRFPGP
ncbi:hypothetical protein ABIA71_000043 [Stenotrophomonas sp. 2619]